MKEAVPHQVDRLSSLREQLGKREGLTLTRAISRLSSLQGLIFCNLNSLNGLPNSYLRIPITSPTILCLPLPDLTCTLSYCSVMTTTPLPPPHPPMSPPCPYCHPAQHPLASSTLNQDPTTDPCSALPTPLNQTMLLRGKTVKFRIKICITFPIPFLSSLLKRRRSKSSPLRRSSNASQKSIMPERSKANRTLPSRPATPPLTYQLPVPMSDASLMCRKNSSSSTAPFMPFMAPSRTKSRVPPMHGSSHLRTTGIGRSTPPRTTMPPILLCRET